MKHKCGDVVLHGPGLKIFCVDVPRPFLLRERELEISESGVTLGAVRTFGVAPMRVMWWECLN